MALEVKTLVEVVMLKNAKQFHVLFEWPLIKVFLDSTEYYVIANVIQLGTVQRYLIASTPTQFADFRKENKTSLFVY